MRRFGNGWIGPMALILGALGPAEAFASAVTYEFGGVVTSARSSGIAPGDRFSGTFTFDPAQAARGFEIEGVGNYVFGPFAGRPDPASTIAGMTLSIGGQSIASTSGAIGISVYEPELAGYRDASGSVARQTSLFITNSPSRDDPYQLDLNLANSALTVYPTLELPAKINLSDFTSATFAATDITPGPSHLPSFAGTIDSLSIVPAPEPSATLLIGAGIVAWAARLRSRGHRRP